MNNNMNGYNNNQGGVNYQNGMNGYPTGVNPAYNMQQNGMNSAYMQQPIYGAPQPKKNTGLIIGIIVAVVLLVVAGLGAFFLLGNNKKEGSDTSSGNTINVCTISKTVQSGTTLESTYTINSKDGYVTSLESVEVVTSDSPSYLNTIYATTLNTYTPYKGLDYYYYDVNLSGNVVTSQVSIDYSKVDTDRMLSIDPSNSSLIQDGKVELSNVLMLYRALGATCNQKN